MLALSRIIGAGLAPCPPSSYAYATIAFLLAFSSRNRKILILGPKNLSRQSARNFDNGTETFYCLLRFLCLNIITGNES